MLIQGTMFIVFAKCSRGYNYSRGYVYSGVQSMYSLITLQLFIFLHPPYLACLICFLRSIKVQIGTKGNFYNFRVLSHLLPILKRKTNIIFTLTLLAQHELLQTSDYKKKGVPYQSIKCLHLHILRRSCRAVTLNRVKTRSKVLRS